MKNGLPKFVRVVRTARGKGVYYYFSASGGAGGRMQERLPPPEHRDFAARYNDCLVRSGRQVPRRTQPRKHLYFIGIEGEIVKVGRSFDVPGRMAALQTASPQRLQILCIAPRMGAVEKDFHKQFEATRQAGEWFLWSPDIASEIAFYRAKFPNEQFIPPHPNEATHDR